ncbi:PaaI family thioesterase [Phenylobacterium sp.]|uniref:PaaI family thioesterase n=1 Tax=Phenylobacterium sp. TaxID=1871053 RepID=UPI0035C86120
MAQETDRAAELNAAQAGTLPALLGVVVDEARHGELAAHFDVAPHHMAPNGYLHAASIIGLVDTACGYGCVVSLPQGATGFTTIELKANYLGTARDGRVSCRARLVHGGRTTQVWDAEATNGEGKVIALFRCTQMILHPR